MKQEREAKENAEEFIKPIVVFEPERRDEQLPIGMPGEEQDGVRFWRVKEVIDNVTKEKQFKWEPVTFEVGGHAILRAVSKEQYESWQNAKLVAQPIHLVFNGKEKVWVVQETNQRLPIIDQKTGEPNGL